jgi:3-oxoacyl-[acyl-carrier protein] reductase
MPDQRNVLITGGTRGLGLAIAKRLTSEPYNIICVGRTPTPELNAVCRRSPTQVMFRAYDLNDVDGIPAFVVALTRDMGPLYGLINNAAIGNDGLLATQHITDIRALLRINLEAPILLAKYACRSMLTTGRGRIVNISSIVSSTGFSGLSVYAATKAGLEGFTRSLARELGKAGITANCVAPGFMETDMTAALSGEKLASIRRRAPLGLPSPDDVTGSIAYLLSDEAGMTTGTVLTIDGGSTA